MHMHEYICEVRTLWYFVLIPEVQHVGSVTLYVYELCRVHMLPDTSCIHLYPFVAVNIFLVSATKLSPVCRPSVTGYKGIQVDRDINE